MTTQRIEYCIKVDNLGQALPADGSYREVLSVLGRRGYPTKMRLNENADMICRPGRELDDETIKQLEEIPGIKVRKDF